MRPQSVGVDDESFAARPATGGDVRWSLSAAGVFSRRVRRRIDRTDPTRRATSCAISVSRLRPSSTRGLNEAASVGKGSSVHHHGRPLEQAQDEAWCKRKKGL